MSNQRLPAYKRSQDPPAMRLTERDGQILEAIHRYDGLLADYQIQQLFFTGRAQMQHRMKLMFQHGYVARPDRKRRASLPYMVYWLAEKGAEYVAGLGGLTLENFKWHKALRWSLVRHDVAINDFRIVIEKACNNHPALRLEDWIVESEFRAYPDEVEVTLPNGSRLKRRIIPDGYFLISDREINRRRFLLELDMSTVPNSRIIREKVLPGIAYLRSPAYERRFGHRSGLWLIVTTGGQDRLENTKHRVEEVADANANVFWFTRLDQVTPENVFTAPVWYRGGEEQPRSLLEI